MKMFAGPATLRALSVLGMREGDAIEAPMLTRAVARAQKKVEERNFQMRKSILEYDEPLNVQRGSSTASGNASSKARTCDRSCSNRSMHRSRMPWPRTSIPCTHPDA